MNLGELKRSLSRFPPDLDDSEIVFTYEGEDGKTDYDLLAFVAYAVIDNEKNPVLVLGSMKAALQKIKDGSIKFPDGSTPTLDSLDLNEE